MPGGWWLVLSTASGASLRPYHQHMRFYFAAAAAVTAAASALTLHVEDCALDDNRRSVVHWSLALDR